MITAKTGGKQAASAHLLFRYSTDARPPGATTGPTVVVARRAWKTAPEKNRARRQVQEILRKKKWNAGTGAGVLIIRALPLPGAADLEREIFSLFQKSGMVAQS